MLVLVKFSNGLQIYKAPKYGVKINVGDSVKVEDDINEGEVIAVLDTYYSDDERLEEFIALVNHYEIKRITKVANWQDVEYPTEGK